MTRDEPSISLPTRRLVLATWAACAVAAGLWAAGAVVLGYAGPVITGGAAGAGLTAVIASAVLLLTMPWIPKPASTAMLLWMVSDFGAMGATLGLGYLLYSATFLPGPPVLLGVVLAFFLALLSKVAVAALHMKKCGLM